MDDEGSIGRKKEGRETQLRPVRLGVKLSARHSKLQQPLSLSLSLRGLEYLWTVEEDGDEQRAGYKSSDRMRTVALGSGGSQSLAELGQMSACTSSEFQDGEFQQALAAAQFRPETR